MFAFPLLVATSLLLIFSAGSARGEKIVLNAVGDIMLAGPSASRLRVTGYDYPFAATTAVLRQGDITLGNLEAPITQRGVEFKGKRFRFRNHPETAAALKRSGFTVLTLANNHIMDYGASGLCDTMTLLNGTGLKYVGAGSSLSEARRPAIVTVRQQRVAFLAYSLTYPEEFYAGERRSGTAPGYGAYITADIRAARSRAEHVVVSFHWGGELVCQPRPYQVRAAHLAIDAGADLVLGHHPHVLQGIEQYGGGMILYSLGNFAFATSSPWTGRSIIARVVLESGACSLELIPLDVLNSRVSLQPRILTGSGADALMRELDRRCRELGTRVRRSSGRFFIDRVPGLTVRKPL